MPPTPTSRPPRAHVAMQVARGGGAGRPETAGGTGSAGRHRTPDPGRLPDPERREPRAARIPAQPSASSRRTPTRPDASGPLVPAPATARSATGRRAAAPVAAVAALRRPAGRSVSRPSGRAATRPSVRSAADRTEAVTDLVAGPARRGEDGAPDVPATGPLPGLLGLALGVLALVAAAAAAAEPGVVLPVIGQLGTSPLALAVLLATALLAAACAGLGTGRHRIGRPVAVTGVVVGLAAVAASVVPLLALASL
jgi:hypothetical protein